jgi:hypothetical protein
MRPRQLGVHSLVVGMLLALAVALADGRPATGDRRPATGDRRPAHLTRIHAALVALPEAERWRLGVVVNWKAGPHLLSYR